MCRRPVSPEVVPVLPVPANPPLLDVLLVAPLAPTLVAPRVPMCGVHLRPALLCMVP